MNRLFRFLRRITHVRVLFLDIKDGKLKKAYLIGYVSDLEPPDQPVGLIFSRTYAIIEPFEKNESGAYEHRRIEPSRIQIL